MTITYSAEVATSNFSCFLKLLLRWKGSVYKLLWKDFLIFAGLFFTLSFIYRFALADYQKRIFEKVANYCETYNSLIPVAFVLGFYVTIVVDRWWGQFNSIPWPDRMALFTTANIHGHDERGRLMRRTLMRYLCLSFVITMSSISPAVKKRFPNWELMTQAGFMLEGEQRVMEEIPTNYNKYFVPLSWATSLVARARKEGRIKDDFAVKTLIDEINAYRGCLGGLFNYDWIGVPLVYTQVVTLAVYTFFLSCLMGRQFLERGHTGDMYFPMFTFLQFFFYMGWLKVAETLVNPFGEDDDDFEINMLVDRNLQVSYLYVDEMHGDHPELIKDQYWDEIDFCLPYTAQKEAARSTEQPFLGSAMNIDVPQSQREFVPLQSVREYDEEENGLEQPANHSPSFIAFFKRGRIGSKRSLTREEEVSIKRKRKISRALSRNSRLSVSSQFSGDAPPTASPGESQLIFPLEDLDHDEGVDEVDDREVTVPGKKGTPGMPSKARYTASPRVPPRKDKNEEQWSTHSSAGSPPGSKDLPLGPQSNIYDRSGTSFATKKHATKNGGANDNSGDAVTEDLLVQPKSPPVSGAEANREHSKTVSSGQSQGSQELEGKAGRTQGPKRPSTMPHGPNTQFLPSATGQIFK